MINTGFLIKEIKETIKTSRLIIVGAVFLFFAIVSPLTARYMNEIIEMFAEGVEISFPEPTHIQSWEQFFSNVTSLCIIVLLIIMTGTVVSEKTKGSIHMVLTKKVSRTNFIASKMLAGGLLYTFVYFISFLVTVYYTQVLFGQISYEGFVSSVIMIWLLGIFYIVLAVFASIISRSSTIAAILGFAGYAALNLFNMAKAIIPYNPAGSASLVNHVMAGNYQVADITTNIISTIAGIAIITMASLLIFRKQEL